MNQFPPQHQFAFDIAAGITIGKPPFVLIAGPCVVESESMVFDIAGRMKEITESLGLPYVFKASFDKANRTRHDSFRSIGMDESLMILSKVREQLEIPVLTDIHETTQIEEVSTAVDVLQIPAFLCRQTDLLLACGESGKSVNIKKGQFMAPEDMQHAIDKVEAVGNRKVFLTERGSTFGYRNLVVDMRALAIMRQCAPVVFDVTHSVQMPGGLGGASAGQREYAPLLARAAAAVGVDGFFIETHPHPNEALSDGPNMIPLDDMPALLETLLAITTTLQDKGNTP